MIKKKNLFDKKKETKETKGTEKVAWMQSRKNMEQTIINLHHLLDDAHTPDVDLEVYLGKLERLWRKRYGSESWRNKL